MEDGKGLRHLIEEWCRPQDERSGRTRQLAAQHHAVR
ncbi:hypothetical protein ACQZ42_32380 [Rhizobium rhizogenes]